MLDKKIALYQIFIYIFTFTLHYPKYKYTLISKKRLVCTLKNKVGNFISWKKYLPKECTTINKYLMSKILNQSDA